MSARVATDSPAAKPVLKRDRPVTIHELCASSRVLFWVPPQLMDEFFGPAPCVAAQPTRHPDTDESARPAFACAAAR